MKLLGGSSAEFVDSHITKEINNAQPGTKMLAIKYTDVSLGGLTILDL